ncbi:MAG: hypothetical protein KGL52_13455 [Rhodospirillales bacterium]|jgi:hypothetical protein|nr:hypothetical protein [Rhodospirillales bacterium]
MDTQTVSHSSAIAAATADAGTIRLGAGMQRPTPAQVSAAPAPTAASVADSGRIRLGAGMRVPSHRHG